MKKMLLGISINLFGICVASSGLGGVVSLGGCTISLIGLLVTIIAFCSNSKSS